MLSVFSSICYSQPEFKISVDGFSWINSSVSGKINLQINLTIKNVGDKEGYCEDLYGIGLYSSDYQYNDKIKYINSGSYILENVKPGDYISSFLIFEVPKNADNLELKFHEDFGGASKFITKSYNKCFAEETTQKTEGEKLLADDYFREKKYDLAIKSYILCANYDPSRKNEFNKLVCDCYLTMANDEYNKFRNTGAFYYLDNYLGHLKNALTYDKTNSDVKYKIAIYYELKGDENKKNNLIVEAISDYEISLGYYSNYSVKEKMNKLISIERNKKSEIQERVYNREEYEVIKLPNVGFSFKAGLSGQENNNVKNSNLFFWNLQFDLPIKLYTIPPPGPRFSFVLNFDIGYEGSIGGIKEIKKYLGVDSITSSNNGPLIGQLFINSGLGISFLNASVLPLISLNYGICYQHYGFERDNYGNYSILNDPLNNELSKGGLGYGYKIEFALLIWKNPSLSISYSFRSYNVKTDINFLNNKYNEHNFNIGVINF